MGQPGRPVAAAGTTPCACCSQDLSKPMVFQGVTWEQYSTLPHLCPAPTHGQDLGNQWDQLLNSSTHSTHSTYESGSDNQAGSTMFSTPLHTCTCP